MAMVGVDSGSLYSILLPLHFSLSDVDYGLI